MDRLFPHVPSLLSATGCFYLVAEAENKPGNSYLFNDIRLSVFNGVLRKSFIPFHVGVALVMTKKSCWMDVSRYLPLRNTLSRSAI